MAKRFWSPRPKRNPPREDRPRQYEDDIHTRRYEYEEPRDNEPRRRSEYDDAPRYDKRVFKRVAPRSRQPLVVRQGSGGVDPSAKKPLSWVEWNARAKVIFGLLIGVPVICVAGFFLLRFALSVLHHGHFRF